jgi:hypothetical protein
VSDRGAKALVERIDSFWHTDAGVSFEAEAAHILGTTGLFIPDVSKHAVGVTWSDNARTDVRVICFCGWDAKDSQDQSYFDHLTEPAP